MFVIVFAGIAFAVLAMFAVFVLMFISVAFQPSRASVNRRDARHAEPSALRSSPAPRCICRRR